MPELILITLLLSCHTLQVDFARTVQSVAGGGNHSMFLKSDNTLWACGDNSVGQLGDSTTIERHSPVQIMTGVQSVAAGGSHSLILKTNGTLWACGSNGNGQLGTGNEDNRLKPVKITY
jgi:alpha-tubulin suppressor-like RCC1 family protein